MSRSLKPLLHVVHIYVPAPAQTEQYLSSQDAHPSPLSYCPLEHTSKQKLWLTISPRQPNIYIYIYIYITWTSNTVYSNSILSWLVAVFSLRTKGSFGKMPHKSCIPRLLRMQCNGLHNIFVNLASCSL